MTAKDRSDLADLEVLVTAGPTQEPIDPVRYVGNRSSGKMGYALARRACCRGARVTLVSGPVSIPPPAEVALVAVTTAAEMHREVTARAAAADVVIMAAAVADYRPAAASERKIKRTGDALILELLPNPDILSAVGRSRPLGQRPVLVGFALETDDLIDNALGKLERKGCDLLVANLASQSIGRDASVAFILDPSGVIDEPGEMAKEPLADRILDHVVRRLTSQDRSLNR